MIEPLPKAFSICPTVCVTACIFSLDGLRGCAEPPPPPPAWGLASITATPLFWAFSDDDVRNGLRAMGGPPFCLPRVAGLARGEARKHRWERQGPSDAERWARARSSIPQSLESGAAL